MLIAIIYVVLYCNANLIDPAKNFILLADSELIRFSNRFYMQHPIGRTMLVLDSSFPRYVSNYTNVLYQTPNPDKLYRSSNLTNEIAAVPHMLLRTYGIREQYAFLSDVVTYVYRMLLTKHNKIQFIGERSNYEKYGVQPIYYSPTTKHQHENKSQISLAKIQYLASILTYNKYKIIDSNFFRIISNSSNYEIIDPYFYSIISPHINLSEFQYKLIQSATRSFVDKLVNLSKLYYIYLTKITAYKSLFSNSSKQFSNIHLSLMGNYNIERQLYNYSYEIVKDYTTLVYFLHRINEQIIDTTFKLWSENVTKCEINTADFSIVDVNIADYSNSNSTSIHEILPNYPNLIIETAETYVRKWQAVTSEYYQYLRLNYNFSPYYTNYIARPKFIITDVSQIIFHSLNTVIEGFKCPKFNRPIPLDLIPILTENYLKPLAVYKQVIENKKNHKKILSIIADQLAARSVLNYINQNNDGQTSSNIGNSNQKGQSITTEQIVIDRFPITKNRTIGSVTNLYNSKQLGEMQKNSENNEQELSGMPLNTESSYIHSASNTNEKINTEDIEVTPEKQQNQHKLLPNMLNKTITQLDHNSSYTIKSTNNNFNDNNNNTTIREQNSSKTQEEQRNDDEKKKKLSSNNISTINEQYKQSYSNIEFKNKNVYSIRNFTGNLYVEPVNIMDKSTDATSASHYINGFYHQIDNLLKILNATSCLNKLEYDQNIFSLALKYQNYIKSLDGRDVVLGRKPENNFIALAQRSANLLGFRTLLHKNVDAYENYIPNDTELQHFKFYTKMQNDKWRDTLLFNITEIVEIS